MATSIEIHGYCEPRFSGVEEAFRANFAAGLEVGASFAATINGKFVVDVWAGWADEAQRRPWERDTIVNVFSTTKVMTAICMLMLIDRGLLDPDAPVARYWPEFAQAGKEDVLVRHLMSHTSGVAGFDTPVPLETMCDWVEAVSLLAKQKPWWEPGTCSGYHALTFGYLLGELVRRITGKTIGTFFREEVAVPLGADFHIGVREADEVRVAQMIAMPETKPGDIGYITPGSMLYRAMNFSDSVSPTAAALMTRERAWRAAEIPAANGHGNAHSVARVAAAIACGGTLDKVRLLGANTIARALEEQYAGPDLALPIPVRLGLGLGLNSKEMPVGPNPRTLWWSGWGGSLVVMDLDAKLSYAYVMNKMSNNLPDPRCASIAKALYAAL
jgi:CubicO group peptidase (beta-lactamase class C family)